MANMLRFLLDIMIFFFEGVPGDVFWWMIFCSSNMETYNIFEMCTFCTVDGRNPAPVEVGSLSHYLQGFYLQGVYLQGFYLQGFIHTSQVVVLDFFHQQ